MKVCGGGYGACWAMGDGDPGLTIPLGISEEEDDCKQNEKTARKLAKLTNKHTHKDLLHWQNNILPAKSSQSIVHQRALEKGVNKCYNKISTSTVRNRMA